MDTDDPLLQMFVEMPTSITRWFLDTNAWGHILENEERTKGFIQFFSETNHLAGLTIYSLFELSRAERLLPGLDDLFFQLRHNIWVPLLYDYVYERELQAYPSRIHIPWMPISLLTEEDEGVPSVMSNFAADSRFTSQRDKYLQFGEKYFMSLGRFKRNFPQKVSEGYTPEEAFEFARLNGLNYFRRNDKSFIHKIDHGPASFEPRGIQSQFARSIFLFYKFYIHGKSPNKSDFMDFANISYLPYFDVYVTEWDVLNTLKHIKTSTDFMKGLNPQHVSGFVKGLVRLNG